MAPAAGLYVCVSADARNDVVAELLGAHGAALRRTARRHSLCADDAEDACQRALLIALEKAPDTGSGALVRWMHEVTRNEARTVRRARERLLGCSGLGHAAAGEDPQRHLEHIEADVAEPSDRIERRQRLEHQSRLLACLKPHERRAIALQAAGLSYAEIAELCGWTYTKVNRCLAEGRARLREISA